MVRDPRAHGEFRKLRIRQLAETVIYLTPWNRQINTMKHIQTTIDNNVHSEIRGIIPRGDDFYTYFVR